MTNLLQLPISIDDLLKGRSVEWERLEYKKGWNPEDVLHTLCAFANDFHNLGGGYILIGLEEKNGRPVLPPCGLPEEQLDRIQKELLQLTQNCLQPAYNPIVSPVSLSGITLLVIWVPGGETRPYKAKVSLSPQKSEWAYYLRKQSNTVKASGPDVKELLSLAATVPFDDRYQQQATVEDLQPRLIQEFLKEIHSDLASQVHEMPLAELAEKMHILGGPKEAKFPKNVGLLFFNEHPERFFPVTQIDVVYFPEGPGGDKFEEKVFKGPLGRITRDALSFIERNYLKQTIIKYPDRAEADRIWNYPYAAIEEAVVNAVYHRSYEIREPVEIRIMPEEIVVLSFPGPDRSVNMADLQKGRAMSRRYRNRRIGEFLKELDLTEGRSTGIPKMLKAIRYNGSPEPVFETDEDHTYFITRLGVHLAVLKELTDQVEGDTVQVTDQVIPKEGGATPEVTPEVESDTPQVDEKTPQVEGETQQVTPQVEGETQQVTPQVEGEPQQVTPQVEGETQQVTPQVDGETQQVDGETQQVTQQVNHLIFCMDGELGRKEIMDKLEKKDRNTFNWTYLDPALEQGWIERTQPDSPNSPTQKYRLTGKAQRWKNSQGKNL
jgi:ATP-dependent DNA helicase RecG